MLIYFLILERVKDLFEYSLQYKRIFCIQIQQARIRNNVKLFCRRRIMMVMSAEKFTDLAAQLRRFWKLPWRVCLVWI